jgi:hypothetical protein
MLHYGCNKMSHCNCYTPHIKQVQGALEIDLKFKNPHMLFTQPGTSKTIQTLHNTHTYIEQSIKRMDDILKDCISWNGGYALRNIIQRSKFAPVSISVFKTSTSSPVSSGVKQPGHEADHYYAFVAQTGTILL